MKSQESGPVSAAAAIIPVSEHNDSLSSLFIQHYRRVLLAAYRIAGNMADAEDVAQGVFLRLGTGESAAMANAGSYLYRAAINGALDLLRRRKIGAAEPLEYACGVASTQPGTSPETAIASLELSKHLREAIGELPTRSAEMFALRYLEELENREIAKLMGTSSAVVAVTLHQARSKLKKRLTELRRGTR
jgi:RNA polymerase sigma factor (sigma-70 family)